MVSSTKNPPPSNQRKGPETLHAFRDSLIEDLRSHQSADEAGEHGAPDKDDEPVLKELPHAPGVGATEPSTDFALRQGNLQNAGITSDSPSLTPAQHSAHLDPEQLSALADESSSDALSFEGNESFSAKPSFTGKLSRTAAGGLFIIAIIAIGFTLLSLGRDGDLSLRWLSSDFRVATGSPADPHNQAAQIVSDFAGMQRQLDELAAKQDQAASMTPPDQLKAMASDFAVVRRQLEQLAAKQDQMADDIAKLQTAERSLSQKIASLSSSRTVRIRPQRKVATPENRPAN